MEKESHEEKNNHIISGDFMAKRKRGRPRKDMKLVSNEESLNPPPEFSKNQQQPNQRDKDEAMVGRPVSGMIEATFEAGFLLSVKIGNSDSMLRGVVFKPGCFDRVSVDNDVAPHVPMIRRNIGSSKGGRKSRFRGSRALVPVPNLNNGVSVQHNAMQTETGSQASGASNGKHFETLLTQVHYTGQSIEAESEEQALSIEPLQAIHPVPSYGQGKMTQLLQAVQENVKETHFSKGE